MDRRQLPAPREVVPPRVRRQGRWLVASLQHRYALLRWQRVVDRRTHRHASATRHSRALAAVAAAFVLVLPLPGGPDAALLVGAAASGAGAAAVAASGRRPLQLPPRPVGPVPLSSGAAPLAERLTTQETALGRLLAQVEACDVGCRDDVVAARGASADLVRSLRARTAAVVELERVAAVLPVAEAATVRAPVADLCAALDADLTVHASLVSAAAALATAVAGTSSGGTAPRAALTDAVAGLRARAAGVDVAARAGLEDGQLR